MQPGGDFLNTDSYCHAMHVDGHPGLASTVYRVPKLVLTSVWLVLTSRVAEGLGVELMDSRSFLELAPRSAGSLLGPGDTAFQHRAAVLRTAFPSLRSRLDFLP